MSICDYDNPKLMTDDCLKPLRFISSDILQLKPVKFLAWYSFVVHFVTDLMLLLFIAYLYHDPKQNVLYIAVLIGDYYPTFATALVLQDSEKVAHLKDELPLWAIDTAGPKHYSRIKLETQILSVYSIVTFLICLTGCGLYMQNLSHDQEWFFVLKMIHDFLPDYYAILSSFFRLSIPFFGYAMILHAMETIYYTQHLRYQIIMFNEYTAGIGNCRQGKKEDDLFYDVEYQKEVDRRLRFCIKRWDEYLGAYNNKLKEIKFMMVGFAVCGYFLGISIAIIALSGVVTPDYFPRHLATGLGALLTFVGVIMAGQALETEMEDMVLVINGVKWYNFNKKNKTLYFTLLMNLMTERRLQLSENYSINLELGVAIVKGIYSIVTVYTNMDMRKNF